MNRKRKSTKGFSLVELLISLIIISLIVAAFAPIMTKKLQKGQIVGTGNTKQHEILITPADIGKDEYYYSCEDSLTQDANGKKHLNCTLKNLPETVGAILVGAGGGGGGASDGGEKSFTKEITDLTHTKDKTIKLTPFMKNIKITLLGAGGGGGGGMFSYNANFQNIQTCPEGTIDVSYKNQSGKIMGNYCVTKYNLRPSDYNQYHNNTTILKFAQENVIDKEFPVDVTLVSGTNTINQGDPACWISTVPGYTFLEYGYYGGTVSCTQSLEGDYPTCGRTVCNWYAASQMCAELALGGNTCRDGSGNFTASCKGMWHLPSGSELNYNGVGGIFKQHYKEFSLCAGYRICNGGYGYCLGSSKIANGGDICSPSTIWGEIVTLSPFVAQSGGYSNGTWDGGRGSNTDYKGSYSVRCTLLKNGYYYYIYSGGGGSSGAYIEDVSIPDIVFEKCKEEDSNCEIKFNVGKGGAGASSMTYRGKAGGDTLVELVNNNIVLWKYIVKGGNGGESASGSSAGQGALALDVETSCEECIEDSCTVTACTKTSLNGSNGDGYQGNDDKKIQGGLGAKSAMTPSKGDGGQGGLAFNTNNSSNLNGNAGQTGYAKITYDGKAQGAAGGGGGGGAVAKVKAITIPSSTQVFAQVGVGGSSLGASDGIDGGDTTFSTYAAYGGKGGKKGAAETSSAAAQLGKGGAGGTLFPETLQSATKNESAWGEDGKDAVNLADNSIVAGGNGGISGITVSSKIIDTSLALACGGFVNEACNSSFGGVVTANGSFVEFKKPSKLLTGAADYGAAGAGGAGGGWKFDGINTFIGAGGRGTDGYLYVWW